jgi:peptide/nickel transport system substrate-binding protein
MKHRPRRITFINFIPKRSSALKLRKLVPALIVTALAMSACTGSPSNVDQTSLSGNYDWPSEGTPGGGGKIAIVGNDELEGLAPGEAGTAGHAFPVMRNVMQSLLNRNTTTNEIEPYLALSWKPVDNLTWEFELRQDVSWHDGTKLDANTAAASLTYIWNKEILYAGNFVSGPATFVPTGPYTLQMKLEQPDPQIPGRMTVLPLASPTQIAQAPGTLPEKPIGTGPYEFVSWTRGQDIKLKLYQGSWQAAPGMFDTVEWVFRKESAVRGQLVQTGEADIALGVTSDQCTASAQDGARCVAVATNSLRFLRIDQYNQTVLSDPRIRRAIAMGVDRPGIADAFIASDQTVLENPGPKGMLGFVDSGPGFKFDANAAKSLVAEAKAAGVNTALPLTVKYRIGMFPNIEEIAQTIVTNLNSIGLTAQIQAMADDKGLAEYRQNFQDNTLEKITPDRGWLWVAPTTNELLDFSQVGDTLLTCKGRFSVYCNKDFEAAYGQAKLLTGDERAKAFQALWTKYYASDVPLLPLAQPVNQFVISDRVKVTPRSDVFINLAEARAKH